MKVAIAIRLAGLSILSAIPVGALGIPPITMGDVTFEVSNAQDGQIAARLWMGKYEPNDFWSIIQDSGGVWQQRFMDAPELVVVWDRYQSLMGESTQQAALHAPAWWNEMVLDGAKRRQAVDPGEAERLLKRHRLIAKCECGPYTIIVQEVHAATPGVAPAVLPRFLRRFPPDGYKITGELLASSAVVYLLSLAPGVLDDTTGTRRIAEREAHDLLAFEEIIDLPAEGERHAAVRIQWQPEGLTGIAAQRRVFLCCKVEASLEAGYGLRLEQLASRDNKAPLEPGIKRVSDLLRRSLDVTTLEEQKALWAEGFGDQISYNYQASRERSEHISSAIAARSAMPGAGQITKESRIVASIPTQFGRYYYLDTGSADKQSDGLWQVVLVPAAHGGILSPALQVEKEQRQAGYIDGILVRPGFKTAVRQYLEQRHPRVFDRRPPE